ncbi:hypothetical protein EHS25_009628 [Saitozyma podzolica]|uniref:Uncharacterized protein n=1 Tax=Saitozyma podzolica TaxID=1890683 RepID=A0A427YJT3_9TREE|nr:hypothetical protein EHS25_009628 [Saitozyma podzolica]
MENITIRQAINGDLPDYLIPGFTVVTDLTILKRCHMAESSAVATLVKEMESGSLGDVSEEDLLGVASPFAYIVAQILRTEAPAPEADSEAIKQQLHKLATHSSRLMGFESSVLAAASRYHREESEGLPPSDFVEDTRRLVASLRSELEGFHQGTLGMAGMAGIPRVHTARQTIGKLYSHNVLCRMIPEIQHRMNLGEIMSEKLLDHEGEEASRRRILGQAEMLRYNAERLSDDSYQFPRDLQDEINNLHADLYLNISGNDTLRLLGYAATVTCGRGAQGHSAVIDWSTLLQGDLTRDSMARTIHTYKYLANHGIDMTYELTIDGSSGRALVANVTEAMRRAKTPDPDAFEITQDIVDLFGSGYESVFGNEESGMLDRSDSKRSLHLLQITSLPGVSGSVIDVNKVKTEISRLSTVRERLAATKILNNLIKAERDSRFEMYSNSAVLAKTHVFNQKERMFEWIEAHEENGDAVTEQLTAFLTDCNTMTSKLEALEAAAGTTTRSETTVGTGSDSLTVPPSTRHGKRSGKKKNKRKGKSVSSSAAGPTEDNGDNEDLRSADGTRSEVSENSHSQQDDDRQQESDLREKLLGTRYEGLNTLTEFLASWNQLKNEAVSIRFGDLSLEPELRTKYMSGKYHGCGPSMPVPSAYGTSPYMD